MKPLYTCDAVRQLDHTVIHQYNVPGIVLMKRAGQAIFDVLRAQWPTTNQVLVLCGGGNNGGDGYIVAGLAKDRGLDAHVVALADPSALSGDAQRAYQFAMQAKVGLLRPSDLPDFDLTDDTVLIDAMLGTGLKSQVRDDYAAAIAWVNEQGRPVLSVDIPSGLNGDTGGVLGACVKADATVTFIARKLGLFTGQGPSVCGALTFESLETPDEATQNVTVAAYATHLSASDVLKPRARAAYKNQFGHVMVVGGDIGTGGAAMLTAQASARCGAGLVSLATQPAHVAAALARLPEVMALGVPSGQELEPHLDRPSVIAIGPGLGSSPWSEQLLQQVLHKIEAGIPAVLDADALNLLSKGRLRLPSLPASASARWVLTPHSGEAGRLLGCDAKAVEADRPAAAKAIQKTYGGVVVLKGAGTLVYDGQQMSVITDGNPGMATGGCGDVLTGVIAALLAQGLPAARAALLGASLHAQAGDLAAQLGERGLLASDLMDPLRRLMNA